MAARRGAARRGGRPPKTNGRPPPLPTASDQVTGRQGLGRGGSGIGKGGAARTAPGRGPPWRPPKKESGAGPDSLQTKREKVRPAAVVRPRSGRTRSWTRSGEKAAAGRARAEGLPPALRRTAAPLVPAVGRRDGRAGLNRGVRGWWRWCAVGVGRRCRGGNGETARPSLAQGGTGAAGRSSGAGRVCPWLEMGGGRRPVAGGHRGAEIGGLGGDGTGARAVECGAKQAFFSVVGVVLVGPRARAAIRGARRGGGVGVNRLFAMLL